MSEEQVIATKVVFLGGSGVGKSTISNTLFTGKFADDLPNTIGSAFTTKLFDHKDKNLVHKMNVWDTSGQENYFSITKIYFRDANAIVLVADATDEDSLRDAQRYLEEVRDNLVESEFIVFVINKIDLLPGYLESQQSAYSDTPEDQLANFKPVLSDSFKHQCPFFGKLVKFSEESGFAATFWATATNPISVREIFEFIDGRVLAGEIGPAPTRTRRNNRENMFVSSFRQPLREPMPKGKNCC